VKDSEEEKKETKMTRVILLLSLLSFCVLQVCISQYTDCDTYISLAAASNQQHDIEISQVAQSICDSFSNNRKVGRNFTFNATWSDGLPHTLTIVATTNGGFAGSFPDFQRPMQIAFYTGRWCTSDQSLRIWDPAPQTAFFTCIHPECR
jgi:hypothetical protein